MSKQQHNDPDWDFTKDGRINLNLTREEISIIYDMMEHCATSSFYEKYEVKPKNGNRLFHNWSEMFDQINLKDPL